MVLGIRGKQSVLATIAMVGALTGGLSGIVGEGRDHRDRCPQCQKGRLVRSVTGAHYCHRCGHFVSKDGVVKTRTKDQDG